MKWCENSGWISGTGCLVKMWINTIWFVRNFLNRKLTILVISKNCLWQRQNQLILQSCLLRHSFKPSFFWKGCGSTYFCWRVPTYEVELNDVIHLKKIFSFIYPVRKSPRDFTPQSLVQVFLFPAFAVPSRILLFYIHTLGRCNKHKLQDHLINLITKQICIREMPAFSRTTFIWSHNLLFP